MLKFKNILLIASLLFLQSIFNSQISCSQAQSTLSEKEDAFAWQVDQHYRETVKKFSALAEQEYHATITSIIAFIDKAEPFFRDRHESFLYKLRQTIFNWMKRDILSEQNFDEENNRLLEEDDAAQSEGEFPSDEDAWRVNYIESFDKDSLEDDSQQSCDDQSDPSEISISQSEYYDAYQEWQLDRIKDVLDLEFDSIDKFTEDSITIDAVTRFLTSSVEDGHSWLINSIIGESLLTAEDFSEEMHKHTSLDTEILLEIIEGLWFDYDWERYDVSDPLYVAKTYKQTLLDLKEGKAARDLKAYVLHAITRLFTYNNNHFDSAYA